MLELARSLPLLRFDPSLDGDFWHRPGAWGYLNYYGINFSEDFAGLDYGFGAQEVEGYRIASHYWLPSRPLGSLVLVHGYYDHVGLYKHIIRFALENRLAVLAFDLPGHGLSSGEPAAIDSFDRYSRVLAALLERAGHLRPKPWYFCGQSTGAAIGLNYLWQCHRDGRADPFDKLALLAPLLQPHGWSRGRWLFKLLKPFVRTIPREFVANSHDPAFLAFLKQRDPLQARILSVVWVDAMQQWLHGFDDFPRLERSGLLIQGTGDKTVDWRFNLPRMAERLPGLRQVMIEGARHQLLNESEVYRQPVLDALADYLFDG